MSLGILKSDELKRAAERALAGEPDRFLKMLVFHSGLPGPKPNLRLAEVVGEALAGEPASGPVVARMAEDIAAPDTAEVFLPIVAAHALAASVQRGRANDEAWRGLRELAGDERAPVRQGTEHALLLLGKRGHADALVRQLGGWLAHERRDVRWGAAATVLDALASARAMEGLGERQALLDTIGWLIADVVDAPRAAERSDGRRRVLAAIAAIAAAVATTFRSQPDGSAWLKDQMATARHPDLRHAFDEALERMKRHGGAEKVATLTELGEALASSAKPDRHAARRQEGMTSRGKRRKLRSMSRALVLALALVACGGAGAARSPASTPEGSASDEESLVVAGVELPPLPHGVRLDRAPLEAGIARALLSGDDERPELPDTAARAEVDAYVAGPLRTWMLERGRGLSEARRLLADAEREEAEDGERAVAAAVIGVLYVRLALELAELPLPASVRSDPALRLGVRNALLQAASPLFTGAESAFAACAIASVRSTDPSLEPWERFGENAVEAREAPRPIDDGSAVEREAEDGDAG